MAIAIPTELDTSIRNVRLTQLTHDDADEYFDLIQENRDHLTRNGDYRELVAKSRSEIRDELTPTRDGEVKYGIKDGSRLIGSVSLIGYNPQVFGIGYWIGADCTGRGYSTACCRALIDAAKEELGAQAVWAGITHGNDASVAIVKRLGFELARDQPSHLSFVLRLDD